MIKRVLLVGFAPGQVKTAEQAVQTAGYKALIEIIADRQSSAPVDAYVVNGDDPIAVQRARLYQRSQPALVLATGAKPIEDVDAFVPGDIKNATIEKLVQILGQKGRRAPAGFAEAAKGNTSKTEVLVVDDSEIIRRIMGRLIANYGGIADFAEDGKEALAMISIRKYRLVFLDIMMPGMDGFEVCRRIKGAGEQRPSAVFFLSSRDGMLDKLRARAVGCDGYLVKPIEVEKLRGILDKHL